ncbi:MAG: TlpA family protein disulfide reductase [Thermoleophilaceae bacterium]
MEGVLLFVRLALAATFATAALSKLVDLRGFRHTLREFGIPGQIAPLVPLAELAAAAALAVPGSVRADALAVIALLAGFSSEIAAALARGRAPECRCFGQVHSTPLGPRTLARNAMLAAAASVVLVGGAGARLPAAAGLGVMMAVAAIALQAGRRKGRAREQVGGRASAFALTSAEGRAETLVGLLSRGRPVVLVFADPGCGPCLALAPDIARWQADPRLTVAVVSTLPFDGLRDVLLDADRQVSGRYGISATPSAVMISQAGVIEAGPVAGAAAVESLVEPAPAGAVLRRRELIGRWAIAGGSLAVAPWPTDLAFARRRGCKKPRVRVGRSAARRASSAASAAAVTRSPPGVAARPGRGSALAPASRSRSTRATAAPAVGGARPAKSVWPADARGARTGPPAWAAAEEAAVPPPAARPAPPATRAPPSTSVRLARSSAAASAWTRGAILTTAAAAAGRARAVSSASGALARRAVVRT